jgi:hypothetical protein
MRKFCGSSHSPELDHLVVAPNLINLTNARAIPVAELAHFKIKAALDRLLYAAVLHPLGKDANAKGQDCLLRVYTEHNELIAKHLPHPPSQAARPAVPPYYTTSRRTLLGHCCTLGFAKLSNGHEEWLLQCSAYQTFHAKVAPNSKTALHLRDCSKLDDDAYKLLQKAMGDKNVPSREAMKDHRGSASTDHIYGVCVFSGDTPVVFASVVFHHLRNSLRKVDRIAVTSDDPFAEISQFLCSYDQLRALQGEGRLLGAGSGALSTSHRIVLDGVWHILAAVWQLAQLKDSHFKTINDTRTKFAKIATCFNAVGPPMPAELENLFVDCEGVNDERVSAWLESEAGFVRDKNILRWASVPFSVLEGKLAAHGWDLLRLSADAKDWPKTLQQSQAA